MTAPGLTLAAGLVVAFVVLVREARTLYFFGDEWSFLLGRSVSWPGIFEPHNEHWSTLPLLVYRLLFRTLGIDHYLVYALMPLALHVLICVAIYHLLRRHDLPAWPAVLSTLMLAFLCGNLGENPLWVFQIGFLGSAALGLLALLVQDARGHGWPGQVLVWVLTVLSMMCSGMAIPLLLWLGWYVLSSRGLVRSLIATVPPALVYLVWYVAFGRDAVKQAPQASLEEILEFMAAGFASLYQLVLRVPATGGVVFLALLAVAFATRLPTRARTLALSGLATTVTTFAFLGVSRAGFGPETASASRYAYFGILFTLPALTCLVQLVFDRLRGSVTEQRLVYAVVLVAAAVSGSAQSASFAAGRTTLTPGLEQEMLGAVRLADGNQRLLSSVLEPVYAPIISVTALSTPEVRSALPDDRVTRRGLLDASVKLQVAAGPESFALAAADTIGTQGVQGTVPSSGCSTLEATTGAYLDLPPTSTGSQVILSTPASAVPVQLVGDGVVSTAVSLATMPFSPTYVATTARSGTLRITLPTGAFELCQSTAP